MRTATKTRVTAETSIELSINLDSQVESTISTGVGFFGSHAYPFRQA